jgi:hypothetical protein
MQWVYNTPAALPISRTCTGESVARRATRYRAFVLRSREDTRGADDLAMKNENSPLLERGAR